MTVELPSLTDIERRAILGLCILAAFADGAQDESERNRIQQLVRGFAEVGLDLTGVYQDTLGGKFSLTDAAARLQTPVARTLAYEMALGVCQADGALNLFEQRFLSELRDKLQLEATAVSDHQQQARVFAEQPVATPLPPVAAPAKAETELDSMILNAALLNGALELMPQTLATMAIIPLQMRTVYQVGKRYGYELDRGHIKDFLATLGVGLGSQVLEGYARRLIGGLTRSIAGRLAGGLAGQAVGSLFAFATTYALGQVARRYYAGGRTLSAAQLKELFTSMLQEGRTLEGRYTGQMAEKARQVNLTELLPMLNPKSPQ